MIASCMVHQNTSSAEIDSLSFAVLLDVIDRPKQVSGLLFCRCLRIHRRFVKTFITAKAAVSIYRQLSLTCLLTLKQLADVANAATRPTKQSLDRKTHSTLTYCRTSVPQNTRFRTALKLLFSWRYRWITYHKRGLWQMLNELSLELNVRSSM